MNGVVKIPVSGAVRAAANVNAEDVLDVEVETDHTSHTVTVPDDLGAALAGDPGLRAFFDGRSYSHNMPMSPGSSRPRSPRPGRHA